MVYVVCAGVWGVKIFMLEIIFPMILIPFVCFDVVLVFYIFVLFCQLLYSARKSERENFFFFHLPKIFILLLRKFYNRLIFVNRDLLLGINI